MINIIHISYFILFLFFLIILFKLYIKFKFKFWAYQPVFHYYNLFYWINPIGIINRDLPRPNKYCNFFNIVTNHFEERKEHEIKEIVSFLQNHYYREKDVHYYPSLLSFSSYFIGNNSKTFISTYYQSKSLLNNKDLTVSEHREIIGTMTTHPINITIQNTKTISAYYVDNLCVHKQFRKKSIAPQIIQSHEYIQRHKNKKISISLFKREGVLTGIVPLTLYKTMQFLIQPIIQYELPHSSMQLIEISKLNISILIDFISLHKNKFNCFILPDFTNLLNLINTNTIKIFGIIKQHNLIACYIFRDSHMHYKEQKAIEIFASMSNCSNDRIFINGFTIALHKYSKELKAKLVTIENISHNNIIINYILSLNSLCRIISPTAYFFYNYVLRPLKPEDVFVIC